MKDLEIRGAGNLLGGEQSGHIEGVGFDLYVRLVGEAVADFRRGRDPAGEIKIELPVDAHLPHDYVPGERLRLEAYKKLAAVVDEPELPRSRPSFSTATARPRSRSGTSWRSPGCARWRGRRGWPTSPCRAHRAVRTARTSGVPTAPAAAALPEHPRQGGARTILVPKPTTARVGGKPLRDRESSAGPAT